MKALSNLAQIMLGKDVMTKTPKTLHNLIEDMLGKVFCGLSPFKVKTILFYVWRILKWFLKIL